MLPILNSYYADAYCMPQLVSEQRLLLQTPISDSWTPCPALQIWIDTGSPEIAQDAGASKGARGEDDGHLRGSRGDLP